MPDPVLLPALLLVVALISWNPRPMVPIGAVLAIGLLLGDIALGPVALLGGFGVALAQVATAFAARRGRDRAGTSPTARAQREALRARLSASGAFTRITFVMAALPGPTSKFLYPLLGAMRAPLFPAIAGTIVGRTLLYLLTTSLFVWLARGVDGTDRDAADFLIVLVLVFLLWRMIGWVDWRHRAATGEWRLRDVNASPLDARMFMGTSDPRGTDDATTPGAARTVDDDDIVEGEILGEEVEDEDQDQPSDDGGSGSSASLPRGS